MRPKTTCHRLDLLVLVFPPLNGKYYIWNYTEQFMSMDEIREYERDDDIIHATLHKAKLDPRIEK